MEQQDLDQAVRGARERIEQEEFGSEAEEQCENDADGEESESDEQAGDRASHQAAKKQRTTAAKGGRRMTKPRRRGPAIPLQLLGGVCRGSSGR